MGQSGLANHFDLIGDALRTSLILRMRRDARPFLGRSHRSTQGHRAVVGEDLYVLGLCGERVVRDDRFANALREPPIRVGVGVALSSL